MFLKHIASKMLRGPSKAVIGNEEEVDLSPEAGDNADQVSSSTAGEVGVMGAGGDSSLTSTSTSLAMSIIRNSATFVTPRSRIICPPPLPSPRPGYGFGLTSAMGAIFSGLGLSRSSSSWTNYDREAWMYESRGAHPSKDNFGRPIRSVVEYNWKKKVGLVGRSRDDQEFEWRQRVGISEDMYEAMLKKRGHIVPLYHYQDRPSLYRMEEILNQLFPRSTHNVLSESCKKDCRLWLIKGRKDGKVARAILKDRMTQYNVPTLIHIVGL